MFRWKKNQPENGAKDGSGPSGSVEPGNSEDTSDIAAPPLKPFAAKGSHTPAKPPAAPSLHPAPGCRTPPDIPGVASRISERATSTGHDSKRLVIGRDISIGGEVTSCDRLLVEGRAEIDLPNAQQLEVTASGFFRGSAEVDIADISGQFEGDLIAREQLIVRSGGRLSGIIRYGHIVIEAGGQGSGDMQSIDNAPTPDAGDSPKSSSGKKAKPKAIK